MKAIGSFTASLVFIALAAFCGCGTPNGNPDVRITPGDAADAAISVDGMVGNDRVVPPADANPGVDVPIGTDAGSCTPDEPNCVGTPRCTCNNVLLRSVCWPGGSTADMCLMGNTCTQGNHCGISLPMDIPSAAPTTISELATTMNHRIWYFGTQPTLVEVYTINDQVTLEIAADGVANDFFMWTLSDGHGWYNWTNMNSSLGFHGIHGLLTVLDPGQGHQVRLDFYDAGVDPRVTPSAMPRSTIYGVHSGT